MKKFLFMILILCIVAISQISADSISEILLENTLESVAQKKKNSSMANISFSLEYGKNPEGKMEIFTVDSLKGIEVFVGNTTYFDKLDITKKIAPLFDISGGLSVIGDRGFSIYSQFTGGLSFRPLVFMFFNLDGGVRFTGLWNGSLSNVWEVFILPDKIFIDGIVNVSLCLHFLYAAGLEVGMQYYVGTTGMGFLPYISFCAQLGTLKDKFSRN